MLTTVTTATAATAVGISQVAVYGAIGVCILIMLLIAKELLSAYGSEESEVNGKGEIWGRDISAKSLAMNLNAAICPLLFSFALIVIVKVLEVL
jgi:hypothetical protein